MKSQLIGRILGVAVAAAGAFGATSASAQTQVQLDEELLDLFSEEYVQNEGAFLEDAADNQVDLSKLIYSGYGEEQALEFFFINEGAGLRSELSFSVDGSGEENVIFDDISSQSSLIAESDGVLGLGQGLRFLPGETDPVAELGSAIELILSYTDAGIDYTFGTTPSDNVDGLQHVVGYDYTDDEGTGWLILGFEDRYGEQGAGWGFDGDTGFRNGNSDRDFNDVVIAVRGLSTAQDVPEPGLMLGMAGVAGAMLKLRRKQA